MFEDFDFAVLDDPSFKEDAVREELIAPLLKRLGYSPTGDLKVVRSKALAHPFIMIGSKAHPVTIVPDYTLLVRDMPLMVLEAKAPGEPILRSRHVEQAYSYAIHPEIRCHAYGLCNGRDLVLYDVQRTVPFLHVKMREVGQRWADVARAFHPLGVEVPEIRQFKFDFGLHLLMLGMKQGTAVAFPECYLQDLGRVSDELLTASASIEVDGRDEYIVTFDLGRGIVEKMLESLPAEVVAGIRQALSTQPFRIDLDGKVVVQLNGHMGELTAGKFEEFVPVVVNEVVSCHFDPTVLLHSPGQTTGGGSG